jgi:hypothetical protein
VPTFQGQTDQVLKIQVKSFLVAARWLQSAAAVPGEVALEVGTAYVGDTAPIEIEVLDGDGKAYGKITGAMHSNLFRAKLKTDKAAGQNKLTFKAKLTKHGLEMASGPLDLRPPVEFTQLEWQDADKKKIDKISEGQRVHLSAKVKGLQEGESVHCRVYSKTKAHGESLDLETDAKVEQGKVCLPWDHKRNVAVTALPDHHQHSQKVIPYQAFEYLFELSAFGIGTKSDPVPLKHTFELFYGVAPGEAGPWKGKKVGVIAPDGKRTDYAIPADGRIVVENASAGHYQIDESALKEEEKEDSFTPTTEPAPNASPKTSPAGESAAKETSKEDGVEAEPSKKPNMDYDIDKAVKYIDDHAKEKSIGRCAEYVRLAIEAGGIPINEPRPHDAKDYGKRLLEIGFTKVDIQNYKEKKGDLAVLQPPSGERSGHLQMYNGEIWVSDFRQLRPGIYPGPKYREGKVAYEIFRP